MTDLPEIHMPDDSSLPMGLAADLPPIPEGTSGDLAIMHRTLPAGAPLKYFKEVITWEADRTFTILHQRGHTWMSDTPQETTAMTMASRAARGDVLVTGLGLAVFQRTVPDDVRSVTTLEMSPDVMSLVWPHLAVDERQRIILGKAEDTMELLLAQGKRFDFIYLDTWDSGDYEQLPGVNWYIRKAEELLKPGGEVRAWTYESMVRSCIEDGIVLLNSTLRRSLDKATDAKVDGMKAMWPIIGSFVEWVLSCEGFDGRLPTEAEARTWLEHHARTVTESPSFMFKLSQRRIEEYRAKELAEAMSTTPEEIARAHDAYADRVLREGQRRRPNDGGSPMLCKF